MSYTLTEEDKQYLDKIGNHIRTALQWNYIRNLSQKERKQAKQLWENITGKPYITNLNCGACMLELIQRLGKWVNIHLELEHNTEITDNKEVTTYDRNENTVSEENKVHKAKKYNKKTTAN